MATKKTIFVAFAIEDERQRVDFSHYFRWLFANFRECSLIS